MPIRTHAQQDQIKARKLLWFESKNLSHCLFIGFRGGRGIRHFRRHPKDVAGRHRNFCKHGLVRHAVVAIRIHRRDMPLIAPEKERAVPRQGRARIGRQQRIQTLGSRSAGEREGEASALGQRLIRGAHNLFRRSLKQLLRCRQPTDFCRRTHPAPDRIAPSAGAPASRRSAPLRAVPSSRS